MYHSVNFNQNSRFVQCIKLVQDNPIVYSHDVKVQAPMHVGIYKPCIDYIEVL